MDRTVTTTQPVPTVELEDVKSFWRQSSTEEYDQNGLRPTARDPFLQRLVETSMETHLHKDAVLLDVGCGDGTSTIRFSRKVRRAYGVDYIESYVNRARDKAVAAQTANVEFACADVMDLARFAERSGPFDIVVAIRCLINLASWDNQRRAVSQIAAALKPAGLFLLSEGWLEGLHGLNARRIGMKLPPIEPVRYNTLMKRADFERAVAHEFEILKHESLGLYLFLSRVLHPLLVAPSAPRHDDRINELAAEVQLANLASGDFADCDYAGIYVLRKKG